MPVEGIIDGLDIDENSEGCSIQDLVIFLKSMGFRAGAYVLSDEDVRNIRNPFIMYINPGGEGVGHYVYANPLGEGKYEFYDGVNRVRVRDMSGYGVDYFLDKTFWDGSVVILDDESNPSSVEKYLPIASVLFSLLILSGYWIASRFQQDYREGAA